MPLPESVLGTLKRNAKQAEETIALLRKHLAVLEKEASGSGDRIKACYEQKKNELRKENEELRERRNRLKKELEKVEIENGLKIVPLPQVKTEPPVPVSVTETTGKATAEQVVVKDKRPPSDGQQKKKVAKKQNTAAKTKEVASESTAESVDVSRLDLRVGRILTVQKHPDADTLYVEDIDVGEEKPRTVVSGLVKDIPIEKMQNRMVMALCNLKPAKMRGIFSQAMVMCACSPELVEIIDPPSGSVPGDRVVCEGYPGTPDDQLNPKKKTFEKIQPDLHTDDEGVAKYKDSPFLVVGKKGYFRSQTMKNSGIK